MVLKNACSTISRKPVWELQPNRSDGFLFRKPFNTLDAFTESDRGIRIGFSRITAKEKHEYENMNSNQPITMFNCNQPPQSDKYSNFQI